MSPADEGERRAAFEALYRLHHGAVQAYAGRRASDADAHDVVAETFLTAWRRMDDALVGGLPWLYRTAHLVLRNQQRSQRRQEHTALRVTSLPRPVCSDPQESYAERAAVRAAVGGLSVADQELLFLIYWEQLDVKTAAQVLGCRHAAAAVRLHRARRRLRDALRSHPAAAPAGPTANEVAQ
ncbi:MAG: sigma-70 family RNA polymerase sigma factor [Nocardioidaceae bacterium]